MIVRAYLTFRVLTYHVHGCTQSTPHNQHTSAETAAMLAHSCPNQSWLAQSATPHALCHVCATPVVMPSCALPHSMHQVCIPTYI